MARTLVIGKGGREHAIAWRLAKEGRDVVLAPGNWGTAQDTTFETVPCDTDNGSLIALARTEHITDVIVGPEAPLCEGLVDQMPQDIHTFGPIRDCALLEASKSFAKSMMTACKIPTAAYAVFDDHASAMRHVQSVDFPFVIKADGLAGGKGVILPETDDEALVALESLMLRDQFGASGNRVVIEERLTGPEVSLMVMTNGRGLYVLPTSRDHKRLRDGDKGLNTGGMGAVVPSSDVGDDAVIGLVNQFIKPVLTAFGPGISYAGFRYVGLMMTPKGPRALEYNVRLGDPETQALLFGLNDQMGDALESLKDGFDGLSLLSGRPTCCVTLAADGYPASPRKGDVITDTGINTDDRHLFHAGVGEGWTTAGGRVMTAVGAGTTAESARFEAYARAKSVRWSGQQLRSDIGLG